MNWGIICGKICLEAILTLLVPNFLAITIYGSPLIDKISALIILDRVVQWVNATPTNIPIVPLPVKIEINTNSIRWGIPWNKSISHKKNLSIFFPNIAHAEPIITANTQLTSDATTPIIKLVLSPFIVRVNISLPIQSVPNICFKLGGLFRIVKSTP